MALGRPEFRSSLSLYICWPSIYLSVEVMGYSILVPTRPALNFLFFLGSIDTLRQNPLALKFSSVSCSLFFFNASN